MVVETADVTAVGHAAQSNNYSSGRIEGSVWRASAFEAEVVPFSRSPRRKVSKLTPEGKRRILVVGAGVRAVALREALMQSGRAIEIAGFIPAPRENHSARLAKEIVTARSLRDAVQDLRVNEIVIAVSDRRGGVLPLRELLDCKLNGVPVYDEATHSERYLNRLPVESLYASWLIFGAGFKQNLGRRLVKRIFDIVCSLTILTLAAPLMILTAVLIALDSGMPIFYRQERVGRKNRRFNVVKFRSMGTDAERDGKPRWASANDSRVTPIGKWIRKLRIDELPQLFSVLKGDMSLVGPRPERPFFVEQLTSEIPFYAVRHSLRPGVTGWAQVRYHYGASKDDSKKKLEYDLYYVKNHCLLLDLKILFETVAVVLTGKGAQ